MPDACGQGPWCTSILSHVIMVFIAPGNGWSHRRWAYAPVSGLILRYDTDPDGAAAGVPLAGSGACRGRIADCSSDGKET